MYPVDSSIRELFLNENRQIVLLTVQTQNDEFTITDEKIKSGSMKVDRYCVSGKKIEIGSAIASELTFQLYNENGEFDDVKFEGAEIYAQVGVKDWSNPASDEFYVPLGYFTVDQVPKKLSVMSIAALDRMVQFDKAWDSSISFPATISEIVDDCCTNCNVPLKTVLSSLPNYNYEVSARPECDTYREVIQYCAELMGTCAYFDWDGLLRFEWYGSTDIELNPANRYSSDLDENVITITGVSATVGDNVYLYGEEGYVINIEENKLLQDGVEDAVANVGGVLTGFSYTPFNATVKSAPYVYPLDIIDFVDKNEDTHVAIVTNSTFTVNKNTVLSGKGETEQNNSYAKANPLTKGQRAIIEAIRQEVNEALNTRVQSVLEFNDLLANAMGVYRTSIREADGSVKYYLHDNPTLESSNTIYTVNAGGFAYTNSGWNDGNPTWEYGFSKEGNAIFKSVSAYGVEVADPNQDHSAQMIPTGFDIFYKNEKVLTVNDRRTEITDVLVKKRLQSGKIQLVPHSLGADIIYIGD